MYLLGLTLRLGTVQELLTPRYGDIEHWDVPMLQGLASQFESNVWDVVSDGGAGGGETF